MKISDKGKEEKKDKDKDKDKDKEVESRAEQCLEKKSPSLTYQRCDKTSR